MEDRAVVQRGIGLFIASFGMHPFLLTGGQSHEVLHGLRGVVAKEVDDDVALLVWIVALCVAIAVMLLILPR